MADLPRNELAGATVLVLPHGTLVLGATRPINPATAERIKRRLRAAGRDVVILDQGVRIAGSIDQGGTPIFDRMVDSRRWRGSMAIARLAGWA